MIDDIKIRAQCLSEAIDKFNDIDAIMDAANRFYSFIIPTEALTTTMPEIMPETMTATVAPDAVCPTEMEKPDLVQDDEKQEPLKISPLTNSEAKLLQAIISIHNGGIGHATQKALAAKLNKTTATISIQTGELIKKNYIERKTENAGFAFRGSHYIPLRTLDGTLIKFCEKTEANGVTITKCPPGYAQGYGFGRASEPLVQAD